MTSLETKEALNSVEKPAHKSKKFLCWFIFQLLMSSLAITALYKQPALGWPLASFMLGIVFFMGASTMWLIGQQAALDTAVRGFAMIGQAPRNVKDLFEGEKKDG